MYHQLHTELKEGTIGDVQFVTVSFGSNHSLLERMWKKELGGGALLGLGIYAVQLAFLVLGEEPQKIMATGYLNENGRNILKCDMICPIMCQTKTIKTAYS